MAMLKTRLERLERQREFRIWLRTQRLIESLTDE